eukprot:scaffold94825_cov19-Phaeocystis_antarctica.AAC.1
MAPPPLSEVPKTLLNKCRSRGLPRSRKPSLRMRNTPNLGGGVLLCLAFVRRSRNALMTVGTSGKNMR